MLAQEEKRILNPEPLALDDPRCQDPVDLSKNLFREFLKLKGKYLREDGSAEYPKMRLDPDFAKIQEMSSVLKCVDLAPLTVDERTALFINVYNSLTIHALTLVVEEGNTKTLLSLDNFWQRNAYNISTWAWSLDDIEHGVLRGNKLHPTYKDYLFKQGDPRLAFVAHNVDNRIHFALNCGAKSCPPIRLYTAENLNRALTMAAENFCQGSTQVKENEVILSKLLDWYGSDFGENKREVLKAILVYLSEEQRESIKNMGDDVTISFAPYDWSIY